MRGSRAQVPGKRDRQSFSAMKPDSGQSPADALPRAFFLSLCFSIAGSFCAAGENAAAQIPSGKETQQYCANVAAAAEAIRLDRRRKELAALEGEIAARLSMLASKQQELRLLLDRLEAFERRTNDALIGLYSRMKPEMAAAQLAQLDDEIAAALMLQLKAKASSAILGEMEASHGAALARKIVELRRKTDGTAP